jgi:hypothetical protein
MFFGKCSCSSTWAAVSVAAVSRLGLSVDAVVIPGLVDVQTGGMGGVLNSGGVSSSGAGGTGGGVTGTARRRVRTTV